jgi:hypothetical protein
MVNELRIMGVPEAYRGGGEDSYNLHDFDNRNRIKSFVKSVGMSAQDKKNVIISSPISGIGKTRLGVGWLFHLRASDVVVDKFWDNDELCEGKPRLHQVSGYRFLDCREYDYKFEFGGFNVPELIDEIIRKKKGIVIDDLGRENEKATRAYLAIISYCHSHQIPICITTNLTLEAFYAKYGIDIKRRILDNGVAISLVQPS